MPLSPGTRLGVYEVTAKIGEGGMGEVYQARDTTLDRDVALKVLSEAFTADPDRLARFQREAKVLASLNHLNIGVIHGFESSGDTQALVLELIEGPTLADRITEGPLPVDEALTIARQMAEALEAAHEEGIVHRDLKPANVKVRPDGTVKVLDFGLAKAITQDAGSESGVDNPTVSLTGATQMGMVIGTAAYMAPEQARGKKVDTRADVWAFGVVVYEMLTGANPFGGDDVSQTLARVIDREPEWEPLPGALSPVLNAYLRLCLEKDPKRRVQSIGDVRLALDGAFDMGASSPDKAGDFPAAPSKLPIPLLVVTALVAAVVAGVTGWSFRQPSTVTFEPLRFSIGSTVGETMGAASPLRSTTISSDGSFVVYSALSPDTNLPQLYVRRFDQIDAFPLRGGEVGIGPFLSPDGEWVGFVSGGTGVLNRVSILGGPTVRVAEFQNRISGAQWLADDTIIVGTMAGGLYRVPAGGGIPEPLTEPEGSDSHTEPSMISGTNAVLFTESDAAPRDSGQLAILDLDTGVSQSLGLAGFSPIYLATGHIVYAASDGSLRAVGFDADLLQITGTPVPVLDEITVRVRGGADFSVSSDGRLVYLSGESGAPSRRTLVWVDRDGGQEFVDVPERAYTYAALSPDRTRIALDIRDEENDIWVWDIAREALTRLTFDPGFNRGPIWTPDGERIAFTADRDGSEMLHWQRSDGSGTMEMIGTEASQFGTSFSPDMRHLLFGTPMAPPYDIGVITIDGEARTEMLLSTEFSEANAEFSPDGNWIAYQSNESGRDEVYVRPFPDVDAARFQVSTGGGTRPLWSNDGSELFYYLGPDSILAVSVEYEPSFTVGRPEVVVRGQYARPSRTGRHYDVSADAERFLLLADERTTGDEAEAEDEITVVLNWFEELKERVPVP